ncbi:MAG: DNA-binding protein [Clostridiaceae bacterium]|nr:DNA-binding protein [Clostridiaceae bacterium]
MRYERHGEFYVLRLDPGEEIVATLSEFCRAEGVRFGTVSGIGAVREVVIGAFDPQTHVYHSAELKGMYEILALSGNVTEKDGEVYLHLHIVVADETHTARGGHLNRAVISATGEIFIQVIPGAIGRRFDTGIGLNILDI